MKKYLIRFFLFTAILFLLDNALGYLLQFVRPIDYKLFIDTKSEFFKKSEHYDVLMIGDSHIADAVDPRIIKKITGYEAFNLGIYYSAPYENYYTLLAALNHMNKKPSLIMIGTNPEMFYRPVIAGRYTPLIIDDNLIRFKLYLNSEEPYRLSSMFTTIKQKYLFNSLFSKVTGRPYKPTRKISVVNNGYLESRNQTPKISWTNFKADTSSKLINTQVKYFNKILEYAQLNKIKVVIVNPPIWPEKIAVDKKGTNFKEFDKVIASSAKTYNISVFNGDFSILDKELHKRDFLNTEHLNYYGAEKFSTELGKYLVARKL